MSDCSCSSAADSREYCQVHGTGISKYTEYKFYDTLKGANPVENKQPSEWAMKKADLLINRMMDSDDIVEDVAKEFDSLKAESDSWKEQCRRTAEGGASNIDLIQRLKSQADGLAEAMEKIIRLNQSEAKKPMSEQRPFRLLSEIIVVCDEALEAYRKVDKQ